MKIYPAGKELTRIEFMKKKPHKKMRKKRRFNSNTSVRNNIKVAFLVTAPQLCTC